MGQSHSHPTSLDPLLPLRLTFPPTSGSQIEKQLGTGKFTKTYRVKMEGGVFVVKVYLNPNKDTFVRTVGPPAEGEMTNGQMSTDAHFNTGAASSSSNSNNANASGDVTGVEGSIGTNIGSNIGGNRNNVRSGEYDVTQPLMNAVVNNANVDAMHVASASDADDNLPRPPPSASRASQNLSIDDSRTLSSNTASTTNSTSTGGGLISDLDNLSLLTSSSPNAGTGVVYNNGYVEGSAGGDLTNLSSSPSGSTISTSTGGNGDVNSGGPGMVSSSSTLTNESREGKGDSRKYKVKTGIKQDDVTKEYHKLNNIYSLLTSINPTPSTLYPAHPHVIPYQRYFATPPREYTRKSGPVQPVYLVRQYFETTLERRLAVRPFLTTSEKTFITYQLLSAFDSMHKAGVTHGDLKTCNIMLTSYNHVIITDLASFKPVVLPSTDPGEFNFFFGPTREGGVKKCYLAPERFRDIGKGKQKDDDSLDDPPGKKAPTPDEANSTRVEDDIPMDVTPAMDVFSLGCCIIELYLSGEAALDYASLVHYKGNDGKSERLEQKVNKIEMKEIRGLVRHMMKLKPVDRESCASYIERLKAGPSPVFPPSFDFLLSLTRSCRFTDITADSKINLVAKNYGKAVELLTGHPDTEGAKFFQAIISENLPPPSAPPPPSDPPPPTPPPPSSPPPSNTTAADPSWSDLIAETNALLKAIDDGEYVAPPPPPNPPPMPQTPSPPLSHPRAPNPPPGGGPIILILAPILSALPHLTLTSSKVVALHLITRLSYYVDDETRLQRLVPFCTKGLEDDVPIVRSIYARTLTLILSHITSFPPSDSKLFPQYIFPAIQDLPTDPSLVVRVAFSECLTTLAESAKRWMEVGMAMRLHKAINTNPDVPTATENTYDSEMATLCGTIRTHFTHIVTSQLPGSSRAKVALLYDLSRLCAFFGHDDVEVHVMPTLITFHIDRDTELRKAFCDYIPLACSFVGTVSTEQFVIPCLENNLVDIEEKVIAAAVGSLSKLVQMGLLTRSSLLASSSEGILDMYSALLIHPNPQIASSMSDLIVNSAKVVGEEDTQAFILPLIRPFLKYEPTPSQMVSNSDFQDCVMEPVGKTAFQNELLRMSEVRKISRLRKEKRVEDRRSEEDGLRSILDAVGVDLPLSSTPPQTTSIGNAISSVSPGSTAQSTLNEIGAIVGGSVDFPSASSTSSNKSNDNSGGGTEILPPSNSPTPSSPPTKSVPLRDDLLQDERSKLLSMKAYMEMAASHMLSKMFSYENEKSSRQLLSPAQEERLNVSRTIWFPSQKFNELITSGNRTTDVQRLTSHIDVHSVINTYGTKWDKARVGKKGKDDDEISKKLGKKILDREEEAKMEGVLNGNWSSIASQDPTTLETTDICRLINALNIPPLGPKLGVLRNRNNIPYSLHAATSSSATTSNPNATPMPAVSRNVWKPKVNSLLVSSSNVTEHTAPVQRLAVAQDQSFFVSASHDGTSKVWELRNIEQAVDLKSVVTYNGQRSNRVNDVCLIENSHSVATASSEGSIHVWRIDMVGNWADSPDNIGSPTPNSSSRRTYYETGRVQGSSVIKMYDPNEGEALCVSHFNTDSASILLAGTQAGKIHAWDLRSTQEPFCLKLRPELGYLSSMAPGTDRNWLVAGTSRGYMALFDLRFHQPVKLWRHSAGSVVHRLATCFTKLPQDTSRASANRPYVFVASGKNEASVFDVGSGECRQCFRMLGHEYTGMSPQKLPEDVLQLPQLENISLPRDPDSMIPSAARMAFNLDISAGLGPEPSVRALMGKISDRAYSYLITGGTDRKINFWDFTSASQSYNVSGNEGPTSVLPSNKSLFIEIPKQAMAQGRGTQPRLQSSHTDAVNDLKGIDDALLSCGGDARIKVWR